MSTTEDRRHCSGCQKPKGVIATHQMDTVEHSTTEEVRETMKRQHSPYPGFIPRKLKCGARLGQSIDTCPYCEPLRRELSERLQHDG